MHACVLMLNWKYSLLIKSTELFYKDPFMFQGPFGDAGNDGILGRVGHRGRRGIPGEKGFRGDDGDEVRIVYITFKPNRK